MSDVTLTLRNLEHDASGLVKIKLRDNGDGTWALVTGAKSDIRAVSKTITFDGTAAKGAVGTIPLFTASGASLVAVIAVCTTDLVGATATHSVGVAGAATGLIPSALATTIDSGLIVDSTGLLALLGAPNVTPTKALTNAQSIIATIAIAAVTAGVIQYICFYKPLTDTGAVA